MCVAQACLSYVSKPLCVVRGQKNTIFAIFKTRGDMEECLRKLGEGVQILDMDVDAREVRCE